MRGQRYHIDELIWEETQKLNGEEQALVDKIDKLAKHHIEEGTTKQVESMLRKSYKNFRYKVNKRVVPEGQFLKFYKGKPIIVKCVGAIHPSSKVEY